MFDFGADWASSRLVRYPQPAVAATTRRHDHGVIGGNGLAKEILDQIIDRTDGIPLFIEELTKPVIETGGG